MGLACLAIISARRYCFFTYVFLAVSSLARDVLAGFGVSPLFLKGGMVTRPLVDEMS